MMKFLICLALVLGMAEARVLESYNIDGGSCTVSGFDSGGSFATQMHVSYANIWGIGLFGGIPYYCAQGSPATADNCIAGGGPTASELVENTYNFEVQGKIPSVVPLRQSRVFLLHGMNDSLVDHSNINKAFDYYVRLMSGSFIKTVATDLNLEHGWPTEDFGSPCAELNTTLYINNCGYHGAYEMLEWLYGNLVKPNSSQATPGDFYEYDQVEFEADESMDTIGYAYIPTACQDGLVACRFHLHFHGCNIGRETVGDQYVLNTFINQVAEINNIVVLYPQVKSSVENSNGCWDAQGYNDNGAELGNYATQLGTQTSAVFKMIERVVGQTVPTTAPPPMEE